MEDRRAFEAIVYVLRTDIHWNALPRQLGASSTVHDRFQEWEQAGFFEASWQAVDGVLTKALFGHVATGPIPLIAASVAPSGVCQAVVL